MSTLKTTLFILAGSALLGLTSCDTRSTAPQNATMQPTTNDAATATPVSSNASSQPKTDASPTPQSAGNLLSADQLRQLAQLNIPVILPTYLPAGFQVSYFEAHKATTPDDSYYTISYTGPNNTGIQVQSGYQGNLGTTDSTREIDTPLGAVRVDSGRSRQGSPMYLASFRQGSAFDQYGYAIFTGDRLAYNTQNSNSVSDEEFTKVLQSLQVSSQPQPQTQNSAALPAGVYPVPANICQLNRFYRVQTPDGSPLRGKGYQSDPDVTVPNGTTILEPGQESPERVFRRSGVNTDFTLPDRGGYSGDRSLVRLTFGSQFRGQMQVKTLDPGGLLNLRDRSQFTSNQPEPIGTIADGTTVTVLGSTSQAPQSGEFFDLYIQTADGRRGYVDHNYLVCPQN